MRVGKTGEPGIAAAVVDLAMDKQWSGARAWREHMALTQNEVAQRMGITQGAYAQLEAYDAAQQSSLAALKADIDLGIADVKAGRVSKMDMAAIKSQARAAKKSA